MAADVRAACRDSIARPHRRSLLAEDPIAEAAFPGEPDRSEDQGTDADRRGCEHRDRRGVDAADALEQARAEQEAERAEAEAADADVEHRQAAHDVEHASLCRIELAHQTIAPRVLRIRLRE